MAVAATTGNPLLEPARDLVRRVTCPSCWHGFPPSEVLFVAEDPRLLGDPVAGADEPLRFLPSRFDLTGAAMDPMGCRCTRVACPRCRVELPRAMLEMPATFVSMVGAPGAGKTHLLAAGVWSLRAGTAEGLRLTDAEPRIHGRLHAWERQLFGGQIERLAKTETAGGPGYRSVRVDGRDEMMPCPFVFTMHAKAGGDRLLVLYDNAGEHFLPGMDEALRPVTRHLGRSDALVFLMDPGMEPGMRRVPGMPAMAAPPMRQDVLLTEMASRVRQHRGRRSDQRVDVPLVVALTKADGWSASAGLNLAREPFGRDGLDASAIRAAHAACRSLLVRGAPEFMAALEAAFERVLLVPCSATGGEAPGGAQAVQPRWAGVPLLAAMALRDGLEPGGAGA
jgi:hypothetical protein